MTRHRLRYTLLGLLLALATLHGCALLEPLQDPDTRIDRAVEAGEYRQALEIISALDDDERSGREARRGEIEVRAAEAAEQALHEAEEKTAEGSVGRALDILEEADARLPASSVREQRMEELERHRRMGLDALERRHRMMEAGAVAERLRLLDIMRPLARDDDTLPGDIEALRERGARLAAELERDARNGDPEAALERLRLAWELDPERREERERRIAELESETRTAPEPVEPEDTPPLLDAIEQALEEENLVRAGEHCRDLSDEALSGASGERYRSLCGRWEEQRDARTAELLEQGNANYAAGQIHRALEAWEQALELNPEHAGLRSAHERGRRVLERLESLREPVEGPDTPGETLPAP